MAIPVALLCKFQTVRSVQEVDPWLMLCRFAPNVKGFHGDDQLDKLLRDPNVDAVAVVLPVQVMLQVDVCCQSADRLVASALL